MLLRYQRWEQIEKKFEKRRPGSQIENYAAATAIWKQTKNKKYSPKSAKALAFLLSNQNSRCRQAREENSFLSCLRGHSKESVEADLKRLSLFKAADFAKTFGMIRLRVRILELINMKAQDPLGSKVFRDRLGALLTSQQHNEALALARRRELSHLGGPFGDFQRARAFLKKDLKQKAWKYYLKSARSSRASWLRKNIFEDLNANFAEKLKPNQLSDGKYSENRELVELSEFFNRQQIEALKKSLSWRKIVATSNQERLTGDGFYLIRAGWSSQLPLLSSRIEEETEESADRAFAWATLLKQKREHKLALRLLGSYRRAFTKDDELWKIYLDLLKEVNGDRSWSYFNELLKYLQYFPGHTSAHDRLMNLLLGSKGTQIDWAAKRFWETALKKMPTYTDSGRFFYWLRRYYLARRVVKKATELEQDFYLLAPGSFYANELWEDKKKNESNFSQDWRQVSSRQDYLRWLGKYGGKEQSIAFLRKKRSQYYLDSEAVKLWQSLSKARLPSNGMIRLLFRTGDWVKGIQFYKEIYEDKLSEEELTMRLVRLAVWSKQLNVQVRYTRRLMHLKKIPGDPYSLPPGVGHLLYPRPYRETVLRFSRKYNVDESMIYALMHQESLFRETAVSRSNARGLMQIMPRTGNWLARLMGHKERPNLYNPTTNIELGTRYFSQLLKGNRNKFVWAAIAYNGGPGNLRKWKREYYRNDFYLFLERLPNQEARNYCRITSQNWMHYDIIYDLYPTR